MPRLLWSREAMLETDMLFATPRVGIDPADCNFYHVMEVPDYGLTKAHWDLRAGVDDYLGRLQLAGQRVLEIGPASGFLTVSMEQRGAEVVAVEVPDDPGWDFVPYPDSVLKEVLGPRAEEMRRLKNGFWLVHERFKLGARVHYGDVYSLPEALGRFDVALMGSVLLHCHSPLKIVEQCAMRADTLVVTEPLDEDLVGEPVCKLVPTRKNERWGRWWRFSPELFVQFFEVLGFNQVEVTTHEQLRQGKPKTLFTVVATKRTG